MGKWKHRMLSADLTTMTGVCESCGAVKIVLKNRRAQCQVANREQKGHATSERQRKASRGSHGLTIEEARVYRQGKVCEICGSDERLMVDHDHVTGLIRGVLCGRCNSGLGFFRDNISSLAAAIQYLEA